METNKTLKKFWNLEDILFKLAPHAKTIVVSPKLDGVGAFYDASTNKLIVCRSWSEITTFSIEGILEVGWGELVMKKENGTRRDVVGLLNRKQKVERHKLIDFINYKNVEKTIKIDELNDYIEQQKQIDYPIDGIIIERKYAFKLPGPTACATIKKITTQFGKKTGKISYIAWLNHPVKLNEIFAKKVNLSTNKQGYKVGDHIVIELKGQAVPIVIRKENM